MRLVSKIRTAMALVGPARPIILYHKPTARCDCRCRFCNFWVGQPQDDDCLPSEKILALIDRAHSAGMTFYTAWGGEPLLAEGLPAWLARARGHGMATTVCTAGYRLSERAEEVAPYVDQLLLSVEAIGERHDQIRNTPGLFERMCAGLEAFARHGGGEVIIWCNLTVETVDQIEAVAKFAADQGVLIEFFPASLHAGYNEKLILGARERQEAFDRIKRLKKAGLPIYNSANALEMMGDSRRFRCNLARLAVQVDERGLVWACEPSVIEGLEPYGDLDSVDLAGLAQSDAYQKTMRELADCNACLLPCVANMADSLVAQLFRQAGNKLLYGSRLIS